MEKHKPPKMSLGRGLGSLLGEAAVMEVDGARVRMLPINHIHPNPQQPRQHFNDDSLAELAESIREQGVLQPILVRTKPDTPHAEYFEIIAGERRWRAAQTAGLHEVPVLVKHLDDKQALEIALIENLQREDLNPVEIANGYQRLIGEFNYSHEQLGNRLGKSRIAVTNTLRLLRLPNAVLEMIINNTLSPGHARALLGLGERETDLMDVATEVATKGLSVRETERLVRERLKQKPRETTPREGAWNRREPSITLLEENLMQTLGLRVSITHMRGRGRLIMEYDTLEELEGLAARLLPEPEKLITLPEDEPMPGSRMEKYYL